MRYITPFHGLCLRQKNGETGKYGSTPYQFENGELVVGSTSAGGSGNVIVPNLSATDGTALQQVYPNGATDLAKVGQGTLGTDAAYASQVQGLFYEAPDLTVAASTQALVIGLWYKVISGSITHNLSELSWHADAEVPIWASTFRNSVVSKLNHQDLKILLFLVEKKCIIVFFQFH